MTDVDCYVADAVGHIVLNRPGKLNALTPEMYLDINRALKEFAVNDQVKAIALSGNGRAFSAGYDLTLEVQEQDPDERHRFLEGVSNANRWLLWDIPKPTIAIVHGYCLAGALELILGTDFTIATDDCLLGEPEILFEDVPVFLMIPGMMGPKAAKKLLLTGESVDGLSAAACGLISASYPTEKFDAAADAWLERLRAVSTPTFARLKGAINRSYEANGIRTTIESWVEQCLSVPKIGDHGSGQSFAARVNGDGVRSAVRWRANQYRPLDPRRGTTPSETEGS